MGGRAPDTNDRLAVRERPVGTPVMYQSWRRLLFMHWPIAAQALRPLVPPGLEIDTWEGTAWIAITPFTVGDAHPAFLPALPWLSSFDELNLRTYVHCERVTGVWFFSLDASSLAAVLGARTLFHLPYHHASIQVEQQEQTVSYRMRRLDSASPGSFSALWTIGRPLPPPRPDSREFFLIERYCLYSFDGSRLYRCRIHHQPWPLQAASLTHFSSTLFPADRVPPPAGQPLLHCGGPVQVQVWPLEQAG